MKPAFHFGQLVATPGALQTLVEEKVSPGVYLRRHLTKDWGELDEEDKQANDQALIDGERILSAYRLPSGKKIWIITEADRSATTILLPEEY